MPLYSISILLDKTRPVFHQGEYVEGKLLLDNKYELRHDGLFLSLEGRVDVTTNFKSLNLLNTFNGTSRTVPLIDFTHELMPPGRLSPGQTEVPFRMLLDESVDAPTLYETYHGVFISIHYFLKCRLKRPIFYKDLIETLELVVEYEADPIGAPPLQRQPIRFAITSDSINAQERELVPRFKITGQLDSKTYRLNEPITGEFSIEFCDATIRSIELQLVRIETHGLFGDEALSQQTLETTRDVSRDATEVQNIQIGDGNILRNVPISMHMVLPKLFTCPTLPTNSFKIDLRAYCANVPPQATYHANSNNQTSYLSCECSICRQFYADSQRTTEREVSKLSKMTFYDVIWSIACTLERLAVVGVMFPLVITVIASIIKSNGMVSLKLRVEYII